MTEIENAPECGDYTEEEWAHQEQLNELEQLRFFTESSLNDLFESSPDAAFDLVNAFLKSVPERIAQNPQHFILH